MPKRERQEDNDDDERGSPARERYRAAGPSHVNRIFKSPFFNFLHQFRLDYNKPVRVRHQITMEAGRAWKNLSSSEKQMYYEMAERAKHPKRN